MLCKLAFVLYMSYAIFTNGQNLTLHTASDIFKVGAVFINEQNLFNTIQLTALKLVAILTVAICTMPASILKYKFEVFTE